MKRSFFMYKIELDYWPGAVALNLGATAPLWALLTFRGVEILGGAIRGVTFRRCKNTLRHDQYINVLSVHDN